MNLNQTLLPEFDHEAANLRKTLLRVPADKFAFKPHPRSWTMLELATHLQNLPLWGKVTMETDGMDLSIPLERAPLAQTNDELMASLDKNITEARSALESATDEQLMSAWTLRMGENVIFTMPRIAVLRGMIMNHLIHHRGELCVYLRLNDIPVPALYGPSADEQS